MSGKVGERSPEEPQPRTREPVSEAELVRAVEAGEKWAADALYDLLYPSVARSLQRILREAGADYDDLVQTTFERIMRSLLERRSEVVVNLSAWASGIATHVALDSLRARVRERGLFRRDETTGVASLEVAGSANAERHLEARRQLMVVQEVLANMKSDLAEAVLLHDMVGHDLTETAALTSVTVAAAQSRLVRGRKDFLRRVALRRNRGTK